MSDIIAEDVRDVAASINKELTDAMVLEVLEMYPFEQEQDMGVTWDLVIEHCIYSVLV